MRRVAVVLLVVAVLAATAVAVLVLRGDPPNDRELVTEMAAAYLEAWEERDWDAMRGALASPPEGYVEEHSAVVDALAVRAQAFEPLTTILQANTAAVVPFTATLTLAGLGEWTYESELRFVKVEEEWHVDWDRAAIHPSLGPDLALDRTRDWPDRAPILAHDGTQLMGPVEVVEVGVQPSRITDRPMLLAALQQHLGADPARVEADLDRRGVQPDWFIPVARLRQDEYQAVEAAIYPVPGTVFRRTTVRRAPSDGLAAHVLGRAGEITAELLEEWDAPYVQHDIVGLSGLERAFQDQLGGRPSGEVRLVDAAGKVREVLHRFEGTEPQPLRITLDPGVQAAAEAAAEGIERSIAIVAVDPDSGDIRAVVSRPLGEFNRALSGRYPPGSTFKIVTAAASLSGTVGPDETFDCRAEVRVGGRVIRNAGGQDRGQVSFRDAFAHSCNTVFAPLAARLERDVLMNMARDFGFGATYAEELPGDVFGGRFPEPGDDAEAAAAGIGQGRVEASPLHMASVAAGVAAGGWRPPRLIADDVPPPAEALDSAVATTLRELMGLVVTSGTGTLAAVPGRSIFGKTGTAEYGSGEPPPAHAWFVGFDDTMAVAVLVEDGGSGGEVAAPIAARFFAALPRT